MSKKKSAEIELKLDISGYSDGIKQMNKELNTNRNELKYNAEQLKSNADDVDLLTKRQKLLEESLTSSSSKIDYYEDALKKTKEVLGENSKEYYNLNNGLIKAKTQHQKLKNELDSVTDKIKSQSNATEELAKDTKDLSDSMKEAGDSTSSFGDIVTGNLAADAIKGTFEAVKDLAGEMISLEKETREYRRDLSNLEQNAKSAGRSFDTIKKQMASLTALTGESDSAIEGLSNLMATGFDDSEMQIALDNLSGAIIKFPDTLKIESLADSLQETIATGSATGQFSELLERMGINLDDVNKKLSEAATAEERQNVALEILANTGLSKVNEEYRKTNENLLNAAESEELLNQKMAELGEQMTPVTELMNGAMSTGLDILIGAINFCNENSEFMYPILAGIGGFVTVIGVASVATTAHTAIMGVLTTVTGGAVTATGLLSAAMTFLTGPIGIAALAIAGIIAGGVALYQNWDTIKVKAGELWNGLKNKFDEIKQGITNRIDGAKDAVGNAIEGIKKIFNFKWSLPKLSIPKITITGKFSLSPLSVPKFGISWHAKGALFKGTTILPGLDGFHGYGEKGLEYALPLNNQTMTPLAEMLVEKINGLSSLNLEGMILFAEIPVHIGELGIVDRISQKIAVKIKRERVA